MRWVRAAVAVVLALVLVACMSDDDACGCQMPDDDITLRIFLLTGWGPDARLVPHDFEVEPTDQELPLALTALFHYTPPPDATLVNGWAVVEEPITELVSVDASEREVVVNISDDVWDPYPTADLANVPDGMLTARQVVRTVEAAMGEGRPVRIVVNGKPLRGVWLQEIDWPIIASATR